MQLKILAQGRYTVSSILRKGKCPVSDSPLSADANFDVTHTRLLQVIERIADHGMDGIPSSISKVVRKKPKILELKRGDLRLFYFHGHENRIVVCTELIQKKTQRVDRQAVARAVDTYYEYYNSLASGTLIDIGD